MKLLGTDRQGFSLVELLVVVALIAIIGGLATPWILRSNPARTLNAAARAIEGNIQQARLLSQRDNRPYYVDFSQSLNGDATADCVLWRDLGNPPFNQTLDLADNDGDGVPDEIMGSDALFLNTANQPPYGRNYKGIAPGLGTGGPGAGPPNVAGTQTVLFQDVITGATGQRFQANPDGTCTSGQVYLSEAPGPEPTRATYCVMVSPAGSVQVWRWTSAKPVWERRNL